MTIFNNKLFHVFFATLIVSATTNGSAAVIYDAANGATATMGYITVDNRSLPGTEFNHSNAVYTAANILDGDLGTLGNTYSGTEVSPATGNDTAPLDFVGVVWGGTVSDIVSIRLTHALFFDGGWFGTQAGDSNAINQFPPNDAQHNQDDADDVAAPTVQTTTDGGATWVDLGATNDYLAVIQPVVLAESTSLPGVVTFDFASQTGINGIRLVGYGGGRSDIPGGRDEQGFIAVREFEVGRFVASVPEPVTAPVLALGLIALATSVRRRRIA